MHAAAAATAARLAARRAAALAELQRAPLGMSPRSRRLMAAGAPGFGQRLQVCGRRARCARDARRFSELTRLHREQRRRRPAPARCLCENAISISLPVTCRAGAHAGASKIAWRGKAVVHATMLLSQPAPGQTLPAGAC